MQNHLFRLFLWGSFTAWYAIITARKGSLGQGNIFIGVFQEFCSQGGAVCSGGGVSAPRGCLLRGCVSGPGGMPASGGCLLPGSVCSWGVSTSRGSAPRGVSSPGGVPGPRGGGCLLLRGCGLLLWPSGLVTFWFGGLLIEGSLVWFSGEGGVPTLSTRRP